MHFFMHSHVQCSHSVKGDVAKGFAQLHTSLPGPLLAVSMSKCGTAVKSDIWGVVGDNWGQ